MMLTALTASAVAALHVAPAKEKTVASSVVVPMPAETHVAGQNGILATLGGRGANLALYRYADGTAEFQAILLFNMESQPVRMGVPVVARLRRADGSLVEELELTTPVEDCVPRGYLARQLLRRPDLAQEVDLHMTAFVYRGSTSPCPPPNLPHP